MNEPEPGKTLDAARELHDAEREPARSAVKRVSLELLKLVATLLPEVVVFVLGAIVGLAFGVIAGVSSTAELFDGAGVWARAGPIALLLPVLTFVGPTIVGVVTGAFGPLPFVVAVHALALLPFARRDRHRVVFVVAIAYWLPFPVGLLSGGAAEGMTGVLVFGLVLAAMTLLGALVWFAARLLLRGRSLRAFWDHAGSSMLVSAILLLLGGALILWLVIVLFPFLPFAPLALLGAVVLGARLIWVGRHRVAASFVVLLASLHLAAIVGATYLAMRG